MRARAWARRAVISGSIPNLSARSGNERRRSVRTALEQVSMSVRFRSVNTLLRSVSSLFPTMCQK